MKQQGMSFPSNMHQVWLFACLSWDYTLSMLLHSHDFCLKLLRKCCKCSHLQLQALSILNSITVLLSEWPGRKNLEFEDLLVIFSFLLLNQMLKNFRSLVVAAKVRYAKAALNTGVAHCDRLLGQVDLLSLLVKSGCANLLPVEPLPLSNFAHLI
jgi:hypothetical protein